jgi:pimeloyl-ACP methyl ester carboxylesterase
VRRLWITIGLTATVIFVAWSLWAYRAAGEAHAALLDTAAVSVARGEAWWVFAPRRDTADVGLIFFVGALVDPRAYAPLARAVADAGFPVLLVELPRRGAFGGADGPEMDLRARQARRSVPAVSRWVAAGHSRGGAVAARLVHLQPAQFAGLILVGTSHPRDFSLAGLEIPVTRIYGTRDTVADVEKLEANRHNLPPSTRSVAIDGGNHSQFGYYGFQPGDWPATITREQQHRATLQAIVDTLHSIQARPAL